MFRKYIPVAAVVAAFIALSPGAPAFAVPDTGSGGAPIEPIGTGSTGAPIEKLGTGSPDYTKAEPKPSRDDYDTVEDHSTAVSLWEAGERARIANLESSKGRDNSPNICSTVKGDPNYCAVAGGDE